MASNDALIHLAPYDGFSFANSLAADLMVRTPASEQRILISPPGASDASSATLTVENAVVSVAGSLGASGTLTSADVDTLGIRLRRGPGPLQPSGASNTILAQIGRLRVSAPASELLANYKDVDVFLVTPNLATSNEVLTYRLPSGPDNNGRRLSVKNCTLSNVANLEILAVGSTTQVSRVVPLQPGAAVDMYGYLDSWS